MPDPSTDVGELKREVVETRNQSIKTGNQVQNLAHDLKAFDARFDKLEKRTRLVSVGTNVILAVVILGAAHLVHSVRAHQLEKEAEDATEAARSARQEAAASVADMRRQLETVERRENERIETERAALQLIENLDAGRDKQAIAALERLELDHAGELGKRLAGERIADFRRQASAAAYKSAKAHLAAGRVTAALPELERTLKLEPDGRHATGARYMLATNLWGLAKWDDAAAVLRDMLERKPDKALAAEARFLLATAMARSGKKEEAIALFQQVVKSGRYVGSANAYVAALQEGSELPPLPGQKRAPAQGARSGSGSRPTPRPDSPRGTGSP